MNTKLNHLLNAIIFLSAGISIFAIGVHVGLYAHEIPTRGPRPQLSREVHNDGKSLIDENFDLLSDRFDGMKCGKIDNNDLTGYLPVDDPFVGAICGGTTQKLTCEQDDLPPACLVEIEYRNTDDELANEQNPHVERTKVPWGICHTLSYLFHNNLTKYAIY